MTSARGDTPAAVPPGDAPGGHRLALAARGMRVRYRRDTLLIQEGDAGDSLYIVLEGRLKAFSQGEDGRELVYGIIGPGDLVGEMSLDGGPRSASVVTLTDCACAVVRRDVLRQYIADHPDFAFELIGLVIGRARRATESARDMALLDVYGRVARLLDTLALPGPDGTRRVMERLTHRDIASRVGSSREMVSRIMKDLHTGGYVRAEGPDLVLVRALPPAW